MQFLKTVFWALLAAILALFAWVNWTPVTINLWANLQADVKLPILLLVFFLLGWLPTWLIMRARVWGFRRRVEALERNQPAPVETDAIIPDQEAPAA